MDEINNKIIQALEEKIEIQAKMIQELNDYKILRPYRDNLKGVVNE